MPSSPFYIPVSSDKFPPIGRKDNGLRIIELRLTDSQGSKMLDPDAMAFMGYKKSLLVDSPIGRSALSGEPGYLYETADGVSVVLSGEELIRLARRDLTEKEYFGLRKLFGVFHEIHDDFYDEDTGVSLQPMEN